MSAVQRVSKRAQKAKAPARPRDATAALAARAAAAAASLSDDDASASGSGALLDDAAFQDELRALTADRRVDGAAPDAAAVCDEVRARAQRIAASAARRSPRSPLATLVRLRALAPARSSCVGARCARPRARTATSRHVASHWRSRVCFTAPFAVLALCCT